MIFPRALIFSLFESYFFSSRIVNKHSPAIKEIYCHCLANYVISHYILNNLKETNLNARNKRLIFPFHDMSHFGHLNLIGLQILFPQPYDFLENSSPIPFP